MTLTFILNGEDVHIQAEPEERLIDILRDRFNLMSAKPGCRIGRCGACSLIFNGRLVASCLIPAFSIRNSEIITMEGFLLTDEYRDIAEAFKMVNLELCGYCNNGKIFTCEALLGSNERPNREEIALAFKGATCRCTNPKILYDAVSLAADLRQKRLYGRS